MSADAAAFEACISGGGVAVFPADTVYGLACDPASGVAVNRLYALKGRPADKPAAVLFFSLAPALAALPEVTPRLRSALLALLPGPVTLLLPNPLARWPLACGPDPWTLGLRVPAPGALVEVAVPVLQSSANRSGGADPRAVDQIDPALRDGADLLVDGGLLPGTPSTVIDLRELERGGGWDVLREGAMTREEVAAALSQGALG
ncbi:MAG TPA: L-threonylcarbamoyladenylate synthase [Solirubrobacteraceae bacterium]|nr:L-threonylcarbamoyladenylate synthase [Solirubrobacteraceae bacterium]